jgi:hypothetical protein
VRGDEAESLVEPVGIDPALVGGELDENAHATPGLVDRPADHPDADAPVPDVLVHMLSR